VQLRFLGAAGVVTGSKSLVTEGATRLLVDCGLFQGFKENRLRNWDRLQTGPLDAVLLTHAHLDHSGWVPALVAQGYRGPVYCTEATASLLRILWPDSGRIQEEDAEHHNRRGSASHDPARPLYTEQDALRALERLRPVPFHEPLTLGAIEATYHRAGHILGAASLSLRSPSHHLLFSGDLGRPDDGVMLAPEPPVAADTVVMESTYGDRDHPSIDREEHLAQVIRTTAERGGMVLVPTFAVGRAQGLLWSLHRLTEAGRIPRLPIVVDSPMATSATAAVLQHPDDTRLSIDELTAMTAGVQFVGDASESKALNKRSEPFVLLSASGMLTGGRVLHHLVQRAPQPKNTLLFVGFQAPGTRGAHLVSGASTVKVFGTQVEVACHVEQIGGYSAHADRTELITWLQQAPEKPRQVFLNHGDPPAVDALRRQLEGVGYTTTAACERFAWRLDSDIVPHRPDHERLHAAERGLLQFAARLDFRGDDEETVDAVCAAARRALAGELPPIPLVVHGPELGAKVRAALSPREQALLVFDLH